MALILNKIRILNYKSINDVSLNIKKYDESYTTVLVGKNETGKSNLLDAIAFISKPKEEFSYEELKNAQNDKADYVDFYFTYSFSNEKDWKAILCSKIKAPSEIIDEIRIGGIENNTYLHKNKNIFDSTNNIEFECPGDDFLKKYAYIKLSKTDDEENQYDYEILYDKGLETEETSELTESTVSSLPPTSGTPIYKKLTIENLQEILGDIFINEIESNKLHVSKWKYSKEYLITETIDLNTFKSNNNICYPLKNIFNLAGYITQKDIEAKINTLINSPKNINKLASQLEKTTTEYINKIWAESKIRVKIDIQKDLQLDVYITDETDEENTYYMSDRSEGFKQFISLILSISAANETDKLKNNIILIDEPEVHMHPSGIRFMQNELLRIGENNYVFLATHSQFMIDTKNRERHYIVTKPNNNTCVKIWDSTKDLADDEILRQAFGINVLNDLLAKNRILVEGYSDCVLLEKALSVISPNNCITITNGTGSNIVPVASMLKMYNVSVLTIIDADKEGEKYKKEIIKLGTPFENCSVKTLRDLNSEITDHGTIEDTLDINYVVKQLKKAYSDITGNRSCTFAYAAEKPILEEFKNFLARENITKNTSGEILECAKKIIAQNFSPTATSLRNKNPKLLEICNKILEYFKPRIEE